jgi:hypothetical protein
MSVQRELHLLRISIGPSGWIVSAVGFALALGAAAALYL